MNETELSFKYSFVVNEGSRAIISTKIEKNEKGGGTGIWEPSRDGLAFYRNSGEKIAEILAKFLGNFGKFSGNS